MCRQAETVSCVVAALSLHCLPHDLRMNDPVRDLSLLLQNLQPTISDSSYVFTSVPLGKSVGDVLPLATFREAEGLSLIVEAEQAAKANLPVLFRAICITLSVHSDLEAVGLTAAVAGALAHQGISCNVVAGAFHDHLFVPPNRAQDALESLRQLTQHAAESIAGLHHAQITIPCEAEEEARSFYCGLLGLVEVPKPVALQNRGGFWLRVGDREVHVGTEDNVNRKGTKAHLAYRVYDLDFWRATLTKKGITLLEGIPIPGFNRFEFHDPFGNRLELIQRVSST